MATETWPIVAWLTAPWRRTDSVAKRVESAADMVVAASAEMNRATFDHADSAEHVRTTVGAVLDRMDRRGIRDGS